MEQDQLILITNQIENDTIQHLSLLLLLAMALASCTSDSFKIDGNLIELDGHAVSVVLRGDSALVDEVVEVDKKGNFSFKGDGVTALSS